MSSGAHNKHTQENSQVQYIWYILFQHSTQVLKYGRALIRCDKRFGKKKNFKHTLQNGSMPNFHSHCICVARHWSLYQTAVLFQNSMSCCMMHDVDVEFRPSSFCIPELLLNGQRFLKSVCYRFTTWYVWIQCAVDKLSSLPFQCYLSSMM